jgi:phospholipase D1/2
LPNKLKPLVGPLVLGALFLIPFAFIERGELERLSALLTSQVESLRDSGLGGPLVVALFVVGGFAGLPLNGMIVASVALFGGLFGALYALAGAMANALVLYGAGRFLGSGFRQFFPSGKGARLERYLQSPGVSGVALMRVLPLAPFSLVNLIAGSVRVRLRDYLPGTLIGLLPGIVLFGVLGRSAYELFQDPGLEGLAWLGAALVLLGGLLYFTYTRMRETESDPVES